MIFRSPLPRRPPIVGEPKGFPHHAGDLPACDRLGQHGEGPQKPCLLNDQLVQIGREKNARQDGLHLPHPAQRFQAGQLGHVHVQQNEVDFLTADNGERFFPVAGQQRPVAARREHSLERFAERPVVVGD